MGAQEENETRVGMIRRGAIDAGPERIARPRSRRANIGVAVVSVYPPSMENPLVVEKLVAGAPHVIHDLIAAIFLERFAHAPGDIVEHFIPTDPFPLSFTSFADALERIKNPLGIGHLI